MKKRYRDAKGRFCKRWQTPEYKAEERARKQTPEYRAKEKTYHQTPEYKAKRRARRQTPENKAIAKAYLQTPKGRALKRAKDSLRIARKLQRAMLLTEAGKKAITEIHANCPEGWHVDHIAPLQGKTVSGLHVPENLQYLPKSVNTMKNNRWDNSWASHTMDTPLAEKTKAYQLIEERVT